MKVLHRSIALRHAITRVGIKLCYEVFVHKDRFKLLTNI